MRPTDPVQSPELAEASRVVAGVRDGVAAMKRSAPQWDPPSDVGQWADPCTRMFQSHLARLRSASAFTEPEPLFELPPATTPEVGTTEAEADAWLGAAIDGANTDLAELALGTDDQPLRLLFTSLAVGLAGVRNRSIQPVPGSAVPVRFAETGPSSAMEVALSHTWALVRGLEVGLGRLDSDDALTTLGIRRLDGARALRNHLRQSTDDVPPQSAAYELPNAMSDPLLIRQGWGVLEENLLDALCRLFIATGEPEWLGTALDQVPRVHDMGRPLPYWPGWVSR